jgi:uncharacterized protein with HEPN domain
MSSAMPSKSEPEPVRDRRLYVEDMLEFCERAKDYSSGLSLGELLGDQMRYDAILRNLELIGEASTHVDEAIRALAPAIPWREIVGTRNRVAHAYLGISPKVVWTILQEDLPALAKQLRLLLEKLPTAS